ncbi:phage portal protein [Streptomyces pseudogriseolus]|uniref:phage portal protein n=1 Tax=Streptomyces pseudogriseolus TaxID=36817 RepID=UPI003FA27850
MARTLLDTFLNKVPTPYVRRDGRASLFAPTNNHDPQHMLNVMGAVSTLFAVVSATSTAVALADWKLYRKAASGKKEDRTEVTSHAALTVLNKPNTFYTRQELFESEQQHIDLTGEGWMVLYRDPRMPSLGPVEIWPVRPDRIFPIKHPTDYLAGYVYKGPSGEEIPLAREDVIQIRMPNPTDPYRGLGPVQSLMATLYGYQAAIDFNKNFFINGAEPGGIISFPNNLSDEEFTRHRMRWSEQHQGLSNAHRVAVLEAGAQWVDRKYTQRDMQYVELANFSRDVIREAFGVHKHILGQSDDVNLANAQAADADFAKLKTVPRLERFKGALNNDFLPQFGTTAQGLEFDYDNPVPQNAEDVDRERESKANAFSALVSAGVHPDDAAHVVGLPPMRTAPRAAPAPQSDPLREEHR